MKKVLVIAVLVIGLMTFSMNYSSGKIGLGLTGGEPSGIYGRYNLENYKFIDVTAAWSFSSDSISLATDYNLIRNLDGDIYYRYGLGAKIGLANTISVTARAPLGIEYDLTNLTEIPINLFLEIAPGLDILPSINFDLSGGAGFVYFF
ncbi:MAG: hypothetical protein ACQESN_05425 [Thermotogota bacterium]